MSDTHPHSSSSSMNKSSHSISERLREVCRSAMLIAGLSIKEATRKRLVSVLLILGGLFLGFYLFGIYKLEITLDARSAEAGIEDRQVTGVGNLPVIYANMFGMYLVYFLGSLMSVLATVGAISQDLETGVMQSMMARPLSRSGFVLGRWLGFSLVNLGYVGLMVAGLVGGMWFLSGYVAPELWTSLGLMSMAMLVLTSLTILGSTLFTTLANGIGVFVLYGVGFSGGILTLIGKLSNAPTLVTFGQIANVVMPTNALWLSAGYHLKPRLLRDTGIKIPDPIFGSAPAPSWLVPWAVALCVLALVGAIWRMKRRDY